MSPMNPDHQPIQDPEWLEWCRIRMAQGMEPEQRKRTNALIRSIRIPFGRRKAKEKESE